MTTYRAIQLKGKGYPNERLLFNEDIEKLFALRAARSIQPRIATSLPPLAGRQSERILATGGIAGKFVLLR